MSNFIVSGIGTNVGKSVVSAILGAAFQGDYWKPIESGASDSKAVSKLLLSRYHKIHPPIFSLKRALSPHHSARLENRFIDPEKIVRPKTNRPLIIEMAGGVLVPLNPHLLSLDLFQSWRAHWIIVSKHYLGSINHTLLTIEALRSRNVQILGMIFNGASCPDSENAILEFSQIPFLGRVFPEKILNVSIIQRYATQWTQSGTLLLR